jgi:signal transduction histidine kinase
MRQRVALLGGMFAAGSGPDGGYRVAATIPIDEVM